MKNRKRIFARKVAQLKAIATPDLEKVAGGRLSQSWSCCGGSDGCHYAPDDSDDV